MSKTFGFANENIAATRHAVSPIQPPTILSVQDFVSIILQRPTAGFETEMI